MFGGAILPLIPDEITINVIGNLLAPIATAIGNAVVSFFAGKGKKNKAVKVATETSPKVASTQAQKAKPSKSEVVGRESGKDLVAPAGSSVNSPQTLAMI